MTFPFKPFVMDSFRSLLTGLGVSGRDKVTSMHPVLDLITYNQQDLENLYRGNWLAKKIVDIPAFDCTRAWRTWDAEQDDVEKLEEAERQFGIQRKMMSALIKSRLYGGSAILLGVKGTPFNEELDIDKVGKGDLKFVHVVEKWMMQAGPIVRDITSPWFGEPSFYMRSNVPIIEAPGGVTPLESSSLGYKPGETIYIHPSRVVRLTGVDYPDFEHAPDAWGDSVLASIYEAVRDAGLVTQSLANMIADGKVDVFRIPGLTSTLSTQAGTDKLISYLANANVAKSTVNSLVIDREIEWERIQTKFEGLPEVLQAYLLICSAGADIPSTRMLSREPSGQNATGESDIRNYYDRLSSEQKVILTPRLNPLDEVLIRHTLGTRPKEIKYDWNPLWQMTEPEKADVALKKAQAYQIDVNTALIPAEALVKGRENQLIEDGFYPGLQTAIDDLEDSWEEEAEFIPVQQMEQQGEMQQNQLSSQEKMAQQKPDDKPGNGKVNDSRRRVAMIKRQLYGDGISVESMFDEGGQGGLGFMVAGQPVGSARRRKRSKRPFDASDGFVEDATPRTLYVRRDVLNADDIIEWAKSQGFETTLPASDMHVTVVYSHQPVDWMKASEDYNDRMTIPVSGVRMIDLFGPERNCAVLLFNSSLLSRRHNEFIDIGASWDYPQYQPHIAITYQVPFDMDVAALKPYDGIIVLGPEIFESITKGWKNTLQEDA